MKAKIIPWIFVGLLVVVIVPCTAIAQEASAECPKLEIIGPPSCDGCTIIRGESL